MDLVYAISPISGAIIGCFTNWVAIKMLFRPHEEKWIGKFKLPFTPGIIPKERYRLSKAVSKTIDEHLLTKDVVVKAIATENVSKSIAEMLEGLYTKASSCDKGIADIIKIPTSLKPFVVEKMTNALEENNVQQHIAKLLTDATIGILKTDISNIGVQVISNKLYAYITGEQFSVTVTEFIRDLYSQLSESDKPVYTFLPQNFWEQAAFFVKSNFTTIVPFIERFFNDEKVDSVLRGLTAEIIDTHVNKLVSMFLNSDKIYDRIKDSLLEYLNTEEAADDISSKIICLPEKLEKISIKTVAEKIPEQYISILIEKINGLLPSVLSKEAVEDFFAKDGSLYDIIKKYAPDADCYIEKFISDKVSNIYNRYIGDYIDLAVEKSLNVLLSLKVSTFFSMLPKNTLSFVQNLVAKQFPIVVASIAPTLMGSIDMAKVIEEHINMFELGMAEDIIISVIDKELKAITYFGGVLGFLIGLLPLVFHLIGI